LIFCAAKAIRLNPKKTFKHRHERVATVSLEKIEILWTKARNFKLILYSDFMTQN